MNRPAFKPIVRAAADAPRLATRVPCRLGVVAWIVVGLIAFAPSPGGAPRARADEPVRATLGKESAWVGEAVPLIVTLYSPGPFSGTATFELPALPRTVFVRIGAPVVGNEQIGDDSFFTQRHEFAIYSRQVGEVRVSAFRVRFAGKKSFLAPPEDREGTTPELRFVSRPLPASRPSGPAPSGEVLTATRLDASQSWRPEGNDDLKPGDVLVRTLARRAEGTTAMMIPPLATVVPEGTRRYADEPQVRDVTERGASTAERIETIKYQFERPGTYRLPDVAIDWWDPREGRLRRATLPGRDVNVVATTSDDESGDGTSGESLADRRDGRRGTLAVVWASPAAAVVLVAVAWRRRRGADPQTVAARRALAACRANRAADAYAALLEWRRLKDIDASSDVDAEFERHWRVLSECVFGATSASQPWSGAPLAQAFRRSARTRRRTRRSSRTNGTLPALNPRGSSD